MIFGLSSILFVRFGTLVNILTIMYKRIMIECLTYLTQFLPAYVAWVILLFLNHTVIGGSIPGIFASCARALNWGNILKQYSALVRFSLVLLLPRNVLLRPGYTNTEVFLPQKFFVPQKAILP